MTEIRLKARFSHQGRQQREVENSASIPWLSNFGSHWRYLCSAFLAVLLFLSCHHDAEAALADGSGASPIATGSVPVDTRPPRSWDSQFLRVKASFWDAFGIEVSKAGQSVGPNLFSVLPDDAVAGSLEGARHVGHARVVQGFTLGLAAGGVGLAAAGVADRADSKTGWSTNAELLAGGGVLAMFGSLICALVRENELFSAVNSYNFDLVTGRLQD
jgi:hypothetical protein